MSLKIIYGEVGQEMEFNFIGTELSAATINNFIGFLLVIEFIGMMFSWINGGKR